MGMGKTHNSLLLLHRVSGSRCSTGAFRWGGEGKGGSSSGLPVNLGHWWTKSCISYHSRCFLPWAFAMSYCACRPCPSVWLGSLKKHGNPNDLLLGGRLSFVTQQPGPNVNLAIWKHIQKLVGNFPSKIFSHPQHPSPHNLSVQQRKIGHRMLPCWPSLLTYPPDRQSKAPGAPFL